MAKNKTIQIYRSQTPDSIKTSIETIVNQLEKHGRALTIDGNASRVFSRFMADEVRRKSIYFAWCKASRESVIALRPGIRLYRTRSNKIRLEFVRDPEPIVP
jgi:hypothetical protein